MIDRPATGSGDVGWCPQGQGCTGVIDSCQNWLVLSLSGIIGGVGVVFRGVYVQCVAWYGVAWDGRYTTVLFFFWPIDLRASQCISISMLFPCTCMCIMYYILLFSLFDIRFPNADSPWGAFPVWAKLGDSAGKPLRRPPKRIPTSFHLLPLSSLPLYSSSSSLLKPLRGFLLSVSIPFWIVSRDSCSHFAIPLPSNTAGYSLIRRHVLQHPAKAPPLRLPVRCWCCRGCV